MHRPTVRSVVDRWLSHVKTHSPGSFPSLRSSVDRFAQEYGHLAASEVKPDHALAWARDAPAWKPCTRYHYLCRIKSAFIHAAEVGHIRKNPLSRLRIPKAWHPTSRGAEFLIPDDLAELLLRGAKGRLRDVLTGLRSTGARPAELLNAEHYHYDPAGPLIRFLAEPDRGYVWKNAHRKRYGDRNRTIYLTDELKSIVQDNAVRKGWLFPNRRGRRYRYGTLYKHWQTLKGTRRVRNWLTRQGREPSTVILYGWRHSWITAALKRGLTADTVADLTGTSATMIRRHYSHVTADVDAMRKAFLTAIGSRC